MPSLSESVDRLPIETLTDILHGSTAKYPVLPSRRSELRRTARLQRALQLDAHTSYPAP
jgi:hypothetical protein